MDTSLSFRDAFEKLAARYIWCQFLILAALVGLSVLNEVADLPHLLFGASPTTAETRWAEVLLEAAAFGFVAVLQIVFIHAMRRKIRVLHGLIPVCRQCHKVHHGGQWLNLEEFISEHSMAFFHHTACPQCREASEALEAERRSPMTADSEQAAPLRAPGSTLRLVKHNQNMDNSAKLIHS